MYDINRKLHYVFYTQSALDFVVKMYSFAVKKLNEKIVFYIFHSFSYIEYSRVDYSHLSNFTPIQVYLTTSILTKPKTLTLKLPITIIFIEYL